MDRKKTTTVVVATEGSGGVVKPLALPLALTVNGVALGALEYFRAVKVNVPASENAPEIVVAVNADAPQHDPPSECRRRTVPGDVLFFQVHISPGTRVGRLNHFFFFFLSDVHIFARPVVSEMTETQRNALLLRQPLDKIHERPFPLP